MVPGSPCNCCAGVPSPTTNNYLAKKKKKTKTNKTDIDYSLIRKNVSLMLICGPSSNKLYGWTCFETPVSILCPECKAAILAVSEASRLNFNYVFFEEDSQLTLKAINQEIHQD